MTQTCPISQRRIDSQVVRTTSVFIALITALYLFTSNIIFIYLLLIDFSLRLFRHNQYSPLFQLSLVLLRLLNIPPRMSDEAPKRFALYLGWGMSIMIVLSISLNLEVLATSFILVLFSCSLLEMLFEFCVGCKVYQYLQRFSKGQTC